MTEEQIILNEPYINEYTNKFMAYHSESIPVTNETLANAFRYCVIPAPIELYEVIKIRIGGLRKNKSIHLKEE